MIWLRLLGITVMPDSQRVDYTSKKAKLLNIIEKEYDCSKVKYNYFGFFKYCVIIELLNFNGGSERLGPVHISSQY